ncbi:MAG: hypothetical protein AAF368_11990, partial [Planctomycetota bacterium]
MQPPQRRADWRAALALTLIVSTLTLSVASRPRLCDTWVRAPARVVLTEGEITPLLTIRGNELSATTLEVIEPSFDAFARDAIVFPIARSVDGVPRPDQSFVLSVLRGLVGAGPDVSEIWQDYRVLRDDDSGDITSPLAWSFLEAMYPPGDVTDSCRTFEVSESAPFAVRTGIRLIVGVPTLPARRADAPVPSDEIADLMREAFDRVALAGGSRVAVPSMAHPGSSAESAARAYAATMAAVHDRDGPPLRVVLGAWAKTEGRRTELREALQAAWAEAPARRQPVSFTDFEIRAAAIIALVACVRALPRRSFTLRLVVAAILAAFGAASLAEKALSVASDYVAPPQAAA